MLIEEYIKDNYFISTDKGKIDVAAVHAFLSTSYWAEEIPFETVKKSIDNSLCFAVYHKTKLVGFARVISDYTTFGYLADVFIIEEERGKGLSKWLIECILKHKELQSLRNFCLMTKDAHSLYERYGFKHPDNPQNFMTKKIDDFYKKEKSKQE